MLGFIEKPTQDEKGTRADLPEELPAAPFTSAQHGPLVNDPLTTQTRKKFDWLHVISS
jgi:hypothetical protein